MATIAPWAAAAFAVGMAAVLVAFPIRVEQAPRAPRPPHTLPPTPDAGDLLQAFAPVAVGRSDGVCFDYSDGKTWAARVCYPDASPPHPMGRPLMS